MSCGFEGNEVVAGFSAAFPDLDPYRSIRCHMRPKKQDTVRFVPGSTRRLREGYMAAVRPVCAPERAKSILSKVMSLLVEVEKKLSNSFRGGGCRP